MKKPHAKPYKDWKMSAAQAAIFWRLWAGAMRRQGWKPAESDARRHEVLSALGFASIKEVGMTRDFDAVKARLLFLCDHLEGAAEDGDAEPGQRRRYLHRIGEQMRELEAADYGAALKKVLCERFKVVAGISTVEDLRTVELLHLVETLDRCIRDRVEEYVLADSAGENPF